MNDCTVFDAFERIATAHPKLPFLCLPSRADRSYLPLGGEFSYAEVLTQVQWLKNSYKTAGYRCGQRVASLLGSRPEFFYHFLALNALGVSIVPINPDYGHDEMLYQMEHSDALLLVALPERIDGLLRVAQARASNGGAPLPVVDGTDLIALRAGALPAVPTLGLSTPAAPTQIPNRETEASLLYTSGTTGRPKACILSNFYHLNSGNLYRSQGECLTIEHGAERIYNPLPLYHMNALALAATGAILSANCLVLVERFSPARWWQDVVQTGATVIHYLGIVAPTLLNQAPCDEERQHRVKFGLGAGIEPALHRVFEQRFGFPMVEVWGMTETGRIFTDKTEPRLIDTRAFGQPYAGLEARVVDEQDRELPCGQAGELIVRHSAAQPRHGFFSGYLKNQPATEQAWRGGWFHTGDVVTQDATGMLYFVDRKKNIIRRSGENIATAKIEAVLQAHEAVAQVAVLAAPDEVREKEVLTGTQKVQKGQIFVGGEDPRHRAGVIDLRARKKRG
jgi:acyl-CoA synthetase (AMP-forming)/AMP-acid ligase II